MMLEFVAAIVFASAGSSPIPARTAQPTCTDPATALWTLALNYSWPAINNAKQQRAFDAAKQFFITGKDADYYPAVRQYQEIEASSKPSASIDLMLGLLYATGPDLNTKREEIGYRNTFMWRTSIADDNARKTLLATIKRDPSQWLAAVALTHIALGTREKARINDAMDAVQRALAADPANGTLLLAESDLLVAQQRITEARALWTEQSSTSQTTQCTGEMAARAEIAILSGDTSAVGMYQDALAHAAPGELERFVDDIRVIFEPRENAAYRATSPDSQRAWIERFWERSAAKSGISVRTRIAEHVERVAYAQAHYRMVVPPHNLGMPSSVESSANSTAKDGYRIVSAVPHGLPVTNPTPWDVRGTIYVRQGAPDTTIRTLYGSGMTILKNESWIYERDTPPWILTFVMDNGPERGGSPDWEWRYDMGCGISTGVDDFANTGLVSPSPRGTFQDTKEHGSLEARDFYDDLAQFDWRYEKLGDYCGLAGVGGGVPQVFRDEVRAIGMHYDTLMKTVMLTESAPRNFRNRMRMLIAAYSFRDAAGKPEVTALSWIPVADLRDSVPTELLNMTYTLVDETAAPLRHDTTLTVPATSGNGMVRTATTWQDVALNHPRLLIVAEDAANHAHGISKQRDVAVTQSDAKLAMSDIVVGEPDVAGLLVRGSHRISPLPDHAITSGTDFRLFYELYGVTPGDAISTTILVTRNEQKSIAQLLRLYPGRKDARELTFKGVAETDYRGISVQDVAVGGDFLPGEYTIEIVTTTPRGEIKGSTQLIVEAPHK